MTDYSTAHENMVENQLRPSGVDEPRIHAAFRAVPREIFLPARLRPVAYQDEDIDLGNGRHLIEPLVLGRLLQACAPMPEEVALVVGCDTGYAAAVLSKLVATVFLLLPAATAAGPIEARLDAAGFATIIVQSGDPRVGLPKDAPFNLVVLAGSVVEPPAALLQQLEQRGRLAAVVETGRAGMVTVVTRVGDAFGATRPFDARTSPIPEFRPEPSFQF